MIVAGEVIGILSFGESSPEAHSSARFGVERIVLSAFLASLPAFWIRASATFATFHTHGRVEAAVRIGLLRRAE